MGATQAISSGSVFYRRHFDKWTTQGIVTGDPAAPPTLGGPLGNPGFCFFRSIDHRIIMKCSVVNYCHWQKRSPCKRSRSEVKGQGHSGQNKFCLFLTITPIWIHRWPWNHTQILMWHRRSALLFFKVTRQISRSHGTKKSPILTRIGRFWTVTPVWIHRWLCNDAQSLKWHRRGAQLFFRVIHQIPRSHEQKKKKNRRFWPESGVSGLYPVLIHRWLWNDAYSFKLHRCPIVFRGHPSEFKVTRDKKIDDFDPNWGFWPARPIGTSSGTIFLWFTYPDLRLSPKLVMV